MIERVYFTLWHRFEITIIADSPSSSLRGEVIEHRESQIWDYGDILVGIADYVEIAIYDKLKDGCCS